MNTGTVYLECDELHGDKGWLAWPIISLYPCNHKSFSPAADWIKPSEEWFDFGYGLEKNVLDFSDPDFVIQLEEVFDDLHSL